MMKTLFIGKFVNFNGLMNTSIYDYTPNGYTVPAKFGAHFLTCMKNDQKRTKIHLNNVGLTSTEFCKIQIQLRQPPIS